MDNNKNQQSIKSHDYYFISNVLGTEVRDEVSLEFIPSNNTSISKDYIALINNETTGVIKMNSPKYNTDYEYIRSEIADLLDVPSAKVYRIINKNGSRGIISILPFQLPIYKDMVTNLHYIDEKRIIQDGTKQDYYVLNDIISLLDYYLKTGRRKQLPWLEEVTKLSITTPENPLNEPEQIKLLIEKTFNAVKERTTLNEVEETQLRKDYTRRLLFDYITNQINLCESNFQVVSTQEISNATVINRKTQLAKVFGNYYYKLAQVPQNICQFNDRIVDRDALLQTLYDYYYKDIKEISIPLVDSKDSYIDSISRIIFNNVKNDDENFTNAKEYEEIINKNIEKVFTLEKEKNANLVERENKVEETSTTISLNQKAMRKYSESLEKYPLNPKEIQKNVIEETDGVSIDFEETKPKKARNGYTTALLMGAAMAFVCGVGFGIAYIIVKLG